MKPNRQSTITRMLALLVIPLLLIAASSHAAPARQAGDP